MAENDTGDYSERGNKNSTETSVKSSIMKMIEDLERELQRIEGKIAAICWKEEQSGAEKDRFKSTLMENKKTTYKAAGMKEAVGKAETEVSHATAETVESTVVREETKGDGHIHFIEPDTQSASSQRSDAESDDDDDDWAAFISERAAIPVNESNIDLSAPEAKAEFSDDVDDDWDDFCRERVTTTVVDVSDGTGDDFDDFFSDQAAMDKYKAKHIKPGKLRRLIRRIFGRH